MLRHSRQALVRDLANPEYRYIAKKFLKHYPYLQDDDLSLEYYPNSFSIYEYDGFSSLVAAQFNALCKFFRLNLVKSQVTKQDLLSSRFKIIGKLPNSGAFVMSSLRDDTIVTAAPVKNKDGTVNYFITFYVFVEK